MSDSYRAGKIPVLSSLSIRWRLSFLVLVLFAVISPESPDFGDQAHRLNALVGLRQFDFVGWELGAFGAKLEAILSNGHSYLDESSRRDTVLSYLELVRDVNRLERQINTVFSDPEISEPNTATQDLQVELATKRRQLEQIQSTAEAIVQDQVADILIDQGFQHFQQAWPPVMMHMTPLPLILIVSPRDRIERIYGISLVPGLSTPARELLEAQVFSDLDLSSLVVNLGGLGTYPAMITETSDIVRLAEVTAHEWAHHWMAPYPITLNYLTDSQVRTMNETVASIVGTEIGNMVVQRYYPEFAPVEEDIASTSSEATPETEETPIFDFRAEMAETRVKVDELLNDGKIEEAEDYMEARRRLFVENGYAIRKLNQAYFAFYGAYADVPGQAGDNPVGPMLLEIRSRSQTLKGFLRTVSPIASFEELQEVFDEVTGEG